MEQIFEVGQCWTYETLPGFESSRIIIGAIEDIPGVGEIICVTLTNAPMPRPDGSAPDMETIPFVPFARDALEESVKTLDSDSDIDEDLSPEFEVLRAGWKEETDGEEFLPVAVPVFLDMLAAGSRG